jgi:hypothetical protein
MLNVLIKHPNVLMAISVRVMILLALGKTVMAATPATRPAPSDTITLHVKDFPMGKALDQIGAQAGILINAQPFTLTYSNQYFGPNNVNRPPEPTVTIDADNQPFWLVVRHITAQTKWTAHASRNVIIMVKETAPADAPMSLADGFLFTAEKAVREQNIDIDHPPAVRRLEVFLSVHVPPCAHLLGIQALAHVDDARDEAGHSLVPVVQSATAFAGSAFQPDSLMVPVRVPLEFGAATPGRRLSHLRGTITCTVQGPDELWVIEDPLKSPTVSRELLGERLTFMGMSRQDGGCTYTLRTTANGPNGPLLARLVNEDARWRLIDAAGREWLGGGGRGAFGSKGGEFERHFSPMENDGRPDPSRAPAILLISLPSTVTERQVTFEFKDLPLP